MRYEIRTLGAWTDPVTPESKLRSSAVFRADWNNTVAMLGRETDALGANLVVIQVDVEAAELRRDGMLRAGAKVGFRGVRVSFDSKHGPLTYRCDTYERFYGSAMPAWQANVRSVALGLEALRAVSRYGIASRGEHYTGFAALPAGSSAGRMSADDAARLIAGYSEGFTAEQILADRDVRERAYRSAARRTHPDKPGGDTAVFQRLVDARRLLEVVDQKTGGGLGG